MFPDRVVADSRCEEIGWDKSCTLMDKLVERMLPFVPGSPQMIGPVS